MKIDKLASSGSETPDVESARPEEPLVEWQELKNGSYVAL